MGQDAIVVEREAVGLAIRRQYCSRSRGVCNIVEANVRGAQRITYIC